MPELVSRYEFKYLIDEDQEAAARDVLSAFCAPDPFGDNGIYDVVSLYLDTWDYHLARQTLEGQQNRYKLRVRTYGADGPVYAENKERVGATICKLRALVPRASAAALCAGDPTDDGKLAAARASHQDDLDSFRNRCDAIDARPRLWVKYRREAYGSQFGDGARITFDRDLQVQAPTPEHLFTPDPTQWTRVPLRGPPIILELKFNGAFPFWMARIVHALGLQRTSCSKYVQGVAHLGDAPWNRTEWGGQWAIY